MTLLNLTDDLLRLVVELLVDCNSLCALEACCWSLRELIDDNCWRSAFCRAHRRSVLSDPACWKDEYARRTLWSRNWRQMTGCTGGGVPSTPPLAEGQKPFCRALKLLSSASADADATEELAPADAAVAAPTPARRATLVVDPRRAGSDGCFASIGAALASAGPLDTVLVRPGVYHERLRLDVDVELLGAGPLGSVTLVGIDGPALEVSSGASRVANLRIRHETRDGAGTMGGAVLAKLGASLVLEDCEVSSTVGHCVIAQGAHVHLLHNSIGHAKGVGVLLCEHACGVVEDNDISHNGRAGVAVLSGANPLVCRNIIHDGLDSGVMVSTRGRGTIEDNDICANSRAGVAVLAEGQPTVRGNRIFDGRDSGVLVCERGQGAIVDNQIFSNAMAGLAIGKGGESRVTGNTIRDGAGGSLCLSLESNAHLYANIIQHEAAAALHVPEPLLPTLQEHNLVIQHGHEDDRRARAPAMSTLLHIQRQRRDARPRSRGHRVVHRPAVAKVRLAHVLQQRLALQQGVIWSD